MKWYSLVLLLFLTSPVFSQEYLPAELINTQDGLSFQDVRAVIKDSEGYMWFGTRDGLNRYDGVGWTIYKHQPGDSTSINNDEIAGLIEDEKGNLIVWLGKKTKTQLDYFDREKAVFKRAKIGDKEIEDEYIVLWPFITPSSEIFVLVSNRSEKNEDGTQEVQLLKYVGDGEFTLRKDHLSRTNELPIQAMNSPVSAWHFHRDNRDEYELLDLENNRTTFVNFKDFGDHNSLPIDAEGKFWYPSHQPIQAKSFDSFKLPSNVPLSDWM